MTIIESIVENSLPIVPQTVMRLVPHCDSL